MHGLEFLFEKHSVVGVLEGVGVREVCEVVEVSDGGGRFACKSGTYLPCTSRRSYRDNDNYHILEEVPSVSLFPSLRVFGGPRMATAQEFIAHLARQLTGDYGATVTPGSNGQKTRVP